MRIAVLNWRDLSNPEAGGAEEVAHQQAAGLAAKGHSVVLYTSRYQGSQSESTRDGYRIFRVGGRFTVYGAVMNYLSRGKGRYSYDAVIEHVNGMPWFSPLWATAPTLVYLYHPVGRIFFEEVPLPIALVGVTCERLFPRIYHKSKFACLGSSTKTEWTDFGVNPRNIVVTAPGIADPGDRQVESPRTKYPLLVSPGPIKTYKRHELIIRAMPDVLAQLPETKLLITGWSRSDLVGHLMGVARKLGVDESVGFTGRISVEEMTRLYQSCWGVVYASCREGWGLGILEAGVWGTPALGADIPGIRDAIDVAKSGLLFRSGDVRDISTTVREFLSDAKLRSRLGEGAKQRSHSRTWGHHVAEVEALLGGLIGN